jgi:hypothetical protein
MADVTFLEELKRASSALSRANMLAVEPWRSMSGALLDAVIALEELAEDAEAEAVLIDGSNDA